MQQIIHQQWKEEFPFSFNPCTRHDNSTIGCCISYACCVQAAKELLLFKRELWISMGFAPEVLILKCIIIAGLYFCTLYYIYTENLTAKWIGGQSVPFLISE